MAPLVGSSTAISFAFVPYTGVVGGLAKVARQHFLLPLPSSMVVHLSSTSAVVYWAQESEGMVLVPQVQVGFVVSTAKPSLSAVASILLVPSLSATNVAVVEKSVPATVQKFWGVVTREAGAVFPSAPQ